MTEDREKKLNFIVNVIYIAFIIAIIYIALRAVGLVYPFLIALVLVTVFQPVIRFIHNKVKLNQKVVSIIIMILLYVALGFLIVWLVVQAVFLLKDAFTSIPKYYQDTISPALNTLVGWAEGLIADAPESWSTTFDIVESSLMSWLSNAVISISQSGASVLTGFLGSTPAFFVGLVFTILLSFFISIQYDSVIGFLKAQLSEEKSAFVGNLIVLAKGAIVRYFRAVLMLMFITFIEVAIGLLILRVSNAFSIAAGIALFDAFPVLGTGGILIPWIIIELVQENFGMALGLVILYVVVALVRQTIEPRVVGKQLGINPIVSLVSIYLGYRLLGVTGMILFPIIAQILLVLHANGSMTLFKSPEKDEPAQPPVTPEK